MAQYSHWRNFWWLNVALLAATLLGSIFLFPETKWHRQHPKELMTREQKQQTSDEQVISELENPEKINASKTSTTAELTTEATPGQDPYLHKGTPSRQQFRPWQTNAHPFKAIALDLFIPWKLHLYPIIEFSAFVVSWSASSFLTINLTQSQNFAAPPYNFPPQSVGYTNFAILVGALIGLLTNGPLSDWIAARATKRNRGVREPEMRLPALIPYVIIMLINNFVVAFGYEYKWDWRVSCHENQYRVWLIEIPAGDRDYRMYVAFTLPTRVLHGEVETDSNPHSDTCAGIQVAAIPAIASTYAVDSYKPVAGSIFVTITVNKNVWGYGFSKFITPWIIADGYIPPIMLNMCLIFLWCSFGIVFYLYGKTFRKWTSNSFVHNL
jgi:hypothetical protein